MSANGSSSTDAELILAFDASCGTCSRIAARVAEISGPMFRVSSLSHPEVAELRRSALGPGAPWAPTLLDLRSSPARGWTGTALAARLAALIGPRRSWRVLKEIGAIHQERRAGADDGASRLISRARFLGGIPLAVSGASLLFTAPARAGSGAAPRITATPSHTVNIRQLTGRALLDSAMGDLQAPDVQNVLGRTMAVQLQGGTRVEDSMRQPTLGLIRYADAGSTEITPGSTVTGTCAVVGSAEHMVGANTLTVTTYVLPHERHLLTFESYVQEFDGVRTRARLWTTPDSLEGTFTLAALSVNGARPTRPPDGATTLTRAGADPCGGCRFDRVERPGGAVLGTECGGGDFYECIKSSAPCAACLPTCPSPACLVCLAAACPFAYVDCCGGRVPACISCNG